MSFSRQMRRHQERLARKGKTVGVQRASFTGEKLVSVALIYEGKTHHGFRSHADLRASIGDPSPYKTTRRYEAEGFWTSAGRFVTRGEALPIAVAAGQVSARFGGRPLLSADVNW